MKKYASFIFLFLLACAQKGDLAEMNKETKNEKIDIKQIKKITSKKIYFGHQSVGYNIIDALPSLIPSDAVINLKETDSPNDFSKPIFAHSKNGENFKPETKIADFVYKMDSGLGNNVDIAFFKFCYVDITANTDVEKLFTEYKSSMNKLIKKYPKTKFLHITTPVTAEDESAKNKIKSIVKSATGKKTGQEYDNIKRMEYNTLLRKEYGTNVFDLAMIESLGNNKNKHQSLAKKYTTDGGHLNQEGGKLVAFELFKFISEHLL